MSRPSVVCLSSVWSHCCTNVHPRQRLTFRQYFCAALAQGVAQFVLKFWAKSRRGSRESASFIQWGMKNVRFLTNISNMVSLQDMAIVTIEDEYELVCGILNGGISNDLQ